MRELISEKQEKTFRDRPDNIDSKGKKKQLLVKQPKGAWYTSRTIVAIVLLVFFILAPIITIDGNPLMLLDVINRKFYIFSITIYSQDTDIMALIMAVSVIFILLFTVLFGRIWCGWACPHTIFMEMVIRRIEYLFEGNYRSKTKSPTQPTLFIRRLLKHITYIVVILFFTNIFIMWFVGPDELLKIWNCPVSEYWQVYTAMIIVTGFYYWIYSIVRESVCTLFCPYGRMQGVLIDSKSISVIYDYKRGDPRGSKSNGDCIDCKKCISVCPTGIDIKNGTQLECVNCTACIDECNHVMKRIGKPKNLIKYTSAYSIETGKSSIRNIRTYAYGTVLVLLVLVLSFFISNRTMTESTLLRIPGTMYQVVNTDTLSNMYQLKIINKTPGEKNLRLKLISPPEGLIFLTKDSVILKQNGSFDAVIIIKLPTKKIKSKSTKIHLGLYSNDLLLENIKTNFIAPKK